MTTFKLGKLAIDAVAYGVSGNAILGIKDSGKTYTATFVAERLFEAGIPFITFDPIGVWRFMRVPGKGKGYPVVVAGGKEGDLPLTVSGAPEIVRAAMHNGVSLVIDLFDIRLSKADWRRIVRDCVTVLLHENNPHGLRHVFLEEAAEFIPQKVLDGEVYAAVEKLARMGGNSRLGYTLINPRSQEVNKAVLELCENVFLHRQRGKNALENMDKWLAVADVDTGRAIIKSLPDLPQGECWAWIGGEKPQPPVLVKVPTKNSLHPDRRVMRGDKDAKPKNAVDVGSFVEGMRSTLVKVEEEAKANDPKLLRAEIARLNRQMTDAAKIAARDGQRPDPKAIEDAEQRGFERAKKELAATADLEVQQRTAALLAKLGEAIGPLMTILKEEVQAARAKPHLGKQLTFTPSPLPPQRQAPRPAGNGQARPPRPAAPVAPPSGDLSGPQQRLIDAIAWWNALGHDRPTRAQLAFVAGYKPNTGTFNTYLGALSTSGLIEYPDRGRVALTAAGAAAARAPGSRPGQEELVDRVNAVLSGPQAKLLSVLLQAYPDVMPRDQLAEAAGYQPNTGTFNTYLGSLSTLDIVEYPQRGQVRASEWLFP